jgi:tetrahydromethanopterin S-methyltransferase subunit D
MRTLWIASGIVVWALHFTFVYGFTALACARGFPRGIPWALAAAALAAGALAAAIMVKGYRGRSQITDWLSAAVAGLALIAIAYETMAGFLSPPCE